MADASMLPRHPNFKDLTGHPPFGRLTVLRYAGKDEHGRALWWCQCACDGKEVVVVGKSLRNGNTESCGCLVVEHAVRVGHANRTHGHSVGPSDSPEYKAWSEMKGRCHNPEHAAYEDYGARGITVCEEWREDFAAFLAAAGLRPGRGYSIDRIDNELGYQPGNIRWATRVEQENNKRSNRKLTFGIRVMTIAEWARETGLPVATLKKRLQYGWSAERALTTPVRPYGKRDG